LIVLKIIYSFVLSSKKDKNKCITKKYKDMMKKALFTVLMFMGLVLSASAQEEELFYYRDSKGTEFMIRDFIDRKAMTYRFDGDSEDECTMEMRNYKKNGNTETFDIYAKFGYEKGKKRGSITIVTNPDLVVAKGQELDLSKQTATIKDGQTKNLYFLTGDQYNKFHGKSGGGNDESLNPVDKAKEKGKDLLNKGKNLFKKK
jgi:hypothetical protein